MARRLRLSAFPSPAMQTQQYCAPFQQSLYQGSLDAYRAMSSYYSTTGGLNDSRFSRGSSLPYPHQECQYFSDRGDPFRQSSLSLAGTSLGATGMAITGGVVSGDSCFRPEEITDYHEQQQWQWPFASDTFHGLPNVAPIPHPTEVEFPPVKRTIDSGPIFSSASQLPTPASMTVLLNPHTQAEPQLPHNSFEPQPPVHTAAQTRPVPSAGREAATKGAPEGYSREKKHGCTMCHRRFDRPSTLRKHLLVHTGEKAFVCDTCGRRFGVASNLNRHVKKCILKPVNTTLTVTNQAATSPTSDSTSSATTHSDVERQTNLRGRRSSASNVHSPGALTQRQRGTASQAAPSIPKRRRRPPSPSRWIPLSLQFFNLSPPESQKATPVPLPPVKRNMPKEERDSWDENVASSPYHPTGWKGILPGPGLGLGLGFGGKDVRNLNLGRNGGFMLGRVLVF